MKSVEGLPSDGSSSSGASDGVIEIHDPEIDVSQIMEKIRERMRHRREELGYASQTFPAFGATAFPGEPASGEYEADLYYHLRRANELYYQIGVETMLAPSPATRIPVVGWLWGMVRREAHNLVLYYLGKLTRQQATVNRHLVSTMNRMTVQLREQHAELQTLRAKVEQLRQEAPKEK